MSDNLDTERQLLKLTRSKTKAILEKGNLDKIIRHKEALGKIVKELEELKIQGEKDKLQDGETIEDVQKWGVDIESEIDETDCEISHLNQYLTEAEARSGNEKRKKEDILLKQQRDEELYFEKCKLEQMASLGSVSVKSTNADQAKVSSVKMPKLVITKYDGTYERWLSFWNKFEAEIDNTDLPAVTKFSYLKELLEPHVCDEIDGLPFTTEGYTRAKNILKTNHGNTSEIVRAYVRNIQDLPTITGRKVNKIHEFIKILSYNVQSLETLGKLSQSLSMVRGVMEKLPGIKAELVTNQVGWQDWGFTDLLKALENWKAIHPVESSTEHNPRTPYNRNHSFFSKDPSTPKGCVYCDDDQHKSYECKKVVTPTERKRKLQAKKLCFNCTGGKHHAAQCRSRVTCFHCKKKHHSSICDTLEKPPPNQSLGQVALTATHKERKVCHPIVIVRANGITCRALLDTGATTSYASAYLLSLMKINPSNTLTRCIQTITGTITKHVEIYNLEVSNTKGNFVIPVNVTKVNRRDLLSVENPNYPELISRFQHLQGVSMEEKDTKSVLPVHLILGAAEYSKIKTSEPQRTGEVGDPVAEFTQFGWSIMSPGVQTNLDNMFLAQTAQSDYEELCRMDVLGIQDTPSGDQKVVHEEFLEQLRRDPVHGWYETGLPWKGGHPPLPSNEENSLKRLGTLVQRLKKTDKFDEYDSIIQDQLREGVVEPANEPPIGTVFYLPHHSVVRESSESTKTRIVYDASSKTGSQPSLNDCLNTGPPLQNLLFKVLVRGCFHPIALNGDIRKAFLQVRIRTEHRDAMRFHWLEEKDPQRICTLRFTRALFGMGPSPFLLAGVLQCHLNASKEKFPEHAEEIEKELYVDDWVSGGTSVQEVREKKEASVEIFKEASFHLHKWQSNVKELEQEEQSDSSDDTSFAKQQLGNESKAGNLLGLKWDKEADTIEVTIPPDDVAPTKRGILGKIARIYDPLGLIAPTVLQGKLLYRDACEQKCKWDSELPDELTKRWRNWENHLPLQVKAPRSIPVAQEPIQDISLHAFGDASGHGVGAAVYAVVTQESQVNQGLVCAKARLAKQGLTIPRKELVSAHMAVNLLDNVHSALEGFPVTSLVGWVDSSVALHWIRGEGEYKTFVANRVNKIREHERVTWRHVPSKENPADVASRGGLIKEGDRLWWKGPDWLSKPDEWPPDQRTTHTAESNVEVKLTKQLFALAKDEEDELENLLSTFAYWKTLRITAWLLRFLGNVRCVKEKRIEGPLTTGELGKAETRLITKAQQQGDETFARDQLQLNLQLNEDGVLECRGRVQGFYPVYIPDSSLLARKFVEHAHKSTLHGGVGLTMVNVRERHWIPRLRRLVKRVIKDCHGCKRFHAIAYATPPPANLPTTRTEGSTAYQVIGIDYAGPLRYRKSKGKEGKAYILLYACSLTRGVYLELLPNMETSECLNSLQRFIARRGRPERIYSDNGATFVAAAKWVKMVKQDEKLQDYLARNGISWQFNLSRAPWWGGQFERLVGIVKAALYKVIGHGQLSWQELEAVLLSVETTLNNRPMGYVEEEDVQSTVMTPNSLLFLRANQLLEPSHHLIENKDLRKRYKYLQKCKDAVWKRWSAEYLRSLRERYIAKKKGGRGIPTVGEVVIIQSEQKNRGAWVLGMIIELIQGRGGVIRGAKVRTEKSIMERAVQFLYPIELSCDSVMDQTKLVKLNPEAPEFRAKPKRDAAVAAELRIKELVQEDNVDI